MNIQKYTEKAQEAIVSAQQLADREGHPEITPELMHERGVIAYRNVMRAKEKEEEDKALEKLAGKAKGVSKKLSWGVIRSVVMRNLTKYTVNFLGVFMAYAVASGKWLTDDWVRRLLPTVASVVLVALLIWFGFKFAKGSRKAAVAVKRRRVRRAVRRTGAP